MALHDVLAARKSPIDLIVRHFNSCHRIVIAHAEASKTHLMQHLFGAFHARKPLERHRRAVGHTTGQTSCGGFVGIGQFELPSQRAHLRFAKTRFEQRTDDARRIGGFETRSMIADVIGIGAVGDPPNATRLRHRPKRVIQMVLAEKAAIAGIRLIGRIVDLTGLHFDEFDVESGGQCTSFFKFAPRQRR